MIQKLLPWASELNSGSELQIPTTNIISWLKVNILLQKILIDCSMN